jgi:hypothetical protein
MAAVVMNPTDKALDIQVSIAGFAAGTALPAHSIATLIWP